MIKLYSEISKVEPIDDGTIKVWGYASSESIDNAGEIIKADAMRDALPDYMKFGAVREMHTHKAAGTAIEAEVLEDGRLYFGAHIVDAEAVKKIEAGVYKGFSVGGKAKGRDPENKNIITKMSLVEISLVDRPCNPECIFTMMKVDESDLKKGLYEINALCEVIGSVKYLFESCEAEEARENDVMSKVPSGLREWLGEGLKILRMMTDEEVSEIAAEYKISQESASKEADGAKEAVATVELEKADKDALTSMHDHLVKLGFKCSDMSKAEDSESLNKLDAVVSEKEDLVKKFDSLTEEHNALVEEVKKYEETITALQSLPEKSKIALMAIGKGEDIGGSEIKKVAPVLNNDGSENVVMTEVKKALSPDNAKHYLA